VLYDFVKDGTDLSALDHIEPSALEISACPLRSLAGVIRHWPSLTSLKLSHCDRLEDISPLSLLPNLELLEIVYCRKVENYDSIAHLEYLRSSWLQGQENVDISVFARLPQLQELTISRAGSVDVSTLADKSVTIWIDDDTKVSGCGADFRPELRRYGSSGAQS